MVHLQEVKKFLDPKHFLNKRMILSRNNSCPKYPRQHLALQEVQQRPVVVVGPIHQLVAEVEDELPAELRVAR